MEKKRGLRGQITIFIVVGILLLVSIAFLYYIISNRNSKDGQFNIKDTTNTFESLTLFTSRCLEQSSVKAGFDISRNGGYVQLNPGIADIFYDNESIAKYYDYTINPKNNSISLRKIEENYANLTNSYILDCVDNFSSFTANGFKIDYEEPETSVTIELEKTQVTISFNINASFKNSEKIYDEFPTITVPLRIGMFYVASQRVVLDSLVDPSTLNLFYLNNIFFDEGILSTYYETSDRKAIVFYFYEATDAIKMLEDSYNDQKKYMFVFGMKYQ